MSCFFKFSRDTVISIPSSEEKDNVTFYKIMVKVKNVHWYVRHRYRDFRDLNDNLVTEQSISRKLLPPKKVIGNKNAAFVEQRRMELEEYLKNLLGIFRVSMPRVFVKFLEFNKYDTIYILQDLARHFCSDGDSILHSGKEYTFTPLELYSISERMRLPCPPNDEKDQHDFSHVLDFCSQVKVVKYFVRFSTLPNGIIPGKIIIRDMISTNYVGKSEDLLKLPLDEPAMSDGDQLTEVKAQIASSLPFVATNNDPDEVKSSAEDPIKTDPSAAQPVAALNIDELFQKLIASGILNQTNNTVKTNGDEVTVVIDLSKPETIKTRQAGIVHKLFSGMQCSSCGVRFPPEQTMKYSQHLDWHFRQNRRERDSSRKAHSRKWYYDVSDWIQYEEIEDLEDREKNWFEAQQNDIDNLDESSNPKSSSPPPSCPAGPDDVDKVCDMCHDKFEQFYNEEFEEWHLRSAIRVENKIYHPLCYQDYKSSLNVDESTLSLHETDVDDNAMDSVVIVKEEISEEGIDFANPIVDEDDDDVIVVPLEEPSITEIPDDDDDDESTNIVVTTENKGSSEIVTLKVNDTIAPANRNDSIESDVEIQEPNIPFTDLDTYEEVAPKSISTLDESSQSSQFNNVRIKEEPKDESDDEDAFEDVGTFVSADDITQNIDEYVPQPTTNLGSGLDGLVSSIDGNVEIQEAPTSVGVNKIKINITKSVNTIHKSNTIANESISTIPVICNVQDTVSRNEAVITEDVPTVAKSLEIDDSDAIEFVFKPELSNAKLTKVPKVKSGYETSGLCSIM